MIKLIYSYKTRITFSESIYMHHFLLRCIPCESVAQKIIESTCLILPGDQKSFSTDSFGNKLVTGYIGEFHQYFEFCSEGIVELYDYKITEKLNPIFLYVSKLTQPMNKISQIFARLNFTENQSVHEKILLISNEINRELIYVSGITSVQTTAEQALELGYGVCQDFAHIMISVCRQCAIAARYVTGFMQGEGYTHAWIEYYTNGSWYGFDPTNNRLIDTGYIKIAHGRDYADCAIDKGVFRGLAQQNLEVFLKVEQVQQ
jgi:transglutaminase-like putative cysteine protease